MLPKMIIQSNKAKICIEGFNKEIPFIYEYIPSVSVKSEDSADISLIKQDITLHFQYSNKFYLLLEYPEATMATDNYIETVAFAEYLLERRREEQRVYCLHSSAVSKKEKGIIFFGGITDIGKTTLAMKLAEKGFYFISDEKTLLEDTKIVGGVQYIKLRKGWQDKYGRGIVHASKLFNMKETADLSLFVVPYIDNGRKETKKWDSAKFFWHLQEELSRKIRGGSRFINHQTQLAPCIDTELLSMQRISYAKEISKKIKCYAIRGTPDQIATSIEGLL